MHLAPDAAATRPRRRTARADFHRNRELILDAAAEVLAVEQDPSLVTIAEAAGVSRATIYRHFSDLSAIREALTEDVAVIVRGQLRDNIGALASGRATLLGTFSSLVRSSLPRRTRYSDAMSQEAVPDAGLMKVLTPAVGALVRHSQRRGEIRDDLDARVVAEAIIVSGLYAARRVHRDGRPVDESARVFEALVRGFERAPGPIVAD